MSLSYRIFEVPEADLAAMQRSGSSDAQLQGWVLRMRGLPFTATAADVVRFFEGLELARGAAGVVFTCTADGRPLGEAYVELPTEEVQQAAPISSYVSFEELDMQHNTPAIHCFFPGLLACIVRQIAAFCRVCTARLHTTQ